MRGRLLSCLAAFAVLGGCGFHLEGNAPLPAQVKRPYLEAADRQSDFVQSLRRSLLSNGAHLQQNKGDSSAVVSILKDSFTKRVLSVSATNQPNEYEITYAVRVTVMAADKELLPPQELTATRTYSFSEQLLLAKEHEEDSLRLDMANDLADRVMRLLSRL
ncbi:MAG TPA: LPS assembly lipoprotein LptE [Steroidobacteraceae bacterium]|jgi:LPS-assembly lipoprotein